ncbi:hypothetical protein O9992_03230 [Vibrio lentus]|nr:hypothetical protein [Vibrio lentus]
MSKLRLKNVRDKHENVKHNKQNQLLKLRLKKSGDARKMPVAAAIASAKARKLNKQSQLKLRFESTGDAKKEDAVACCYCSR